MKKYHDKWKKLLSTVRPYDVAAKKEKAANKNWEPKANGRTSFEKDHDRILFSSQFRRLIDKTQVFPLERNHDSIHRRLTHSYEVSNIAQSLGRRLVYEKPSWFPEEIVASRNIPAILSAIGLMHDIGNPPIGHTGEKAIRNWVKDKIKEEKDASSPFKELSQEETSDLENYEGNAQMLRLLTKLQSWTHDHALNLTLGTLYSAMKYTVSSSELDKKYLASKKVVFFQSEKDLITAIKDNCLNGSKKFPRHPLAYLLEAADDICYSVMDVEDAIKKGVLSIYDVCDNLTSLPIDQKKYILDLKAQHPNDKNDIGGHKFRNSAIEILYKEAFTSFINNYETIMDGTFNEELLKYSKLKSELKDELCTKIIFQHSLITGMEAEGYMAIQETMEMLWDAIATSKKNRTPFQAYSYSKISNVFKKNIQNNSTTYEKIMAVADMVSGMTDGYLIKFHKDLLSKKNNNE